MEKYSTIEPHPFGDQIPVNLHGSYGQSRLKDFAWRITEELGEALEAARIHPEITSHYDEELSDALHFLVEFTILAGLNENDIKSSYSSSVDGLSILYEAAKDYPHPEGGPWAWVGLVVEALATTCNTLKNKPWKTTQMVTDVDYFRKKLLETWLRFIQLCILSNISEEYLYSLYFKKSEVNKFRQRSNY
jgi:hypothetical protein